MSAGATVQIGLLGDPWSHFVMQIKPRSATVSWRWRCGKRDGGLWQADKNSAVHLGEPSSFAADPPLGSIPMVVDIPRAMRMAWLRWALAAAIALSAMVAIDRWLLSRYAYKPAADRGADLARPRTVRSIAVVGDGTIAARDVAPPARLPAVLQQLLGPQIAVRDLAVAGDSSSWMAARVQDLLLRDPPDLVLVMAGMNNGNNPTFASFRGLRRVVASGLNADTEPQDKALDSLMCSGLALAAGAPALARAVLDSRSEGADEPALAYPDVSLPPHLPPYDDASRAGDAAQAAGDAAAVAEQLLVAFRPIHSGADRGEWDWERLVWLRENGSKVQLDRVLDLLRQRLPKAEFVTWVEDRFWIADHPSAQRAMLWYDLARMRTAAERAGRPLVLLTYPTSRWRSTLEAFARVHNLVLIRLNLPLFGGSLWSARESLTSDTHRELAEQLASALRAAGLVPSGQR